MIPGYDDYHERVQKGLPPYTYAGLVAKIDAQQKEIEAADSELMNFQVNLTELLKMDWPGGVCPSNGVIMAALSAELDRLRKIAVDKEEENRLLFSGLAACVISTGKDRLFIPYSILSKKYQVEIFRDPEQLMGYTVTAKLAEDSCK